MVGKRLASARRGSPTQEALAKRLRSARTCLAFLRTLRDFQILPIALYNQNSTKRGNIYETYNSVHRKPHFYAER